MINAIQIILSYISDFAFIIGAIVVSILSLLAALLGIGWGVRKTQEHVTGVSGFNSELDAKNRLFAAQIHNSKLLEMGDKVQTGETLLNLDKF